MEKRSLVENVEKLEKFLGVTISPYTISEENEPKRKNGAELILEYQKISGILSSCLNNGKINYQIYGEIDSLAREIYNCFLLENDLIKEEKNQLR